MAKDFTQVAFDPEKCRSELTEFNRLLHSEAELSEQRHIQKFFRSHQQLAAFLGSYVADIGPVVD